VLGPSPAADLSGPITNLGFFADFSAEDEDQTLLLDRLELVGHPLFPDEEPWTLVSMPDFTNADIADMSGALMGVPAACDWDGGQNGSPTIISSPIPSITPPGPGRCRTAFRGVQRTDPHGRSSEGTTTTHELTPTSLPARRFYRITETP